MGILAKGVFHQGENTETLDTVIRAFIPPKARTKILITTFKYTAAATAHVLSIIQVRGRTTVASDAAASQKVVNLVAQPEAGNDVAAADLMAFELANGLVIFDVVASVVTLAITMTVNFAQIVKAGSPVWFFGVAGDSGVDTLALKLSTQTSHVDDLAGVISATEQGDPLILESDNATAAGFLNIIAGIYAKF